MRKIQDADVKNKKVLVRADFNVTVENGKSKETFKIAACKESIKYLLGKGAKVALISHLGRPDGKINPEFSLGQIKNEIEAILEVKIKFIDDCVGEKVGVGLDSLLGGEAALLENVRFYPGEEANDNQFSKSLAYNFDIFINDAFSVSHRDQASVTGVTKFLPSYAGFWLQKEIENLDKAKNNPEHPAVAIIGGAKIETKLPVIGKLEENYDFVLVGGKIANEAKDQDMSFSEKVILPIDYAGDRLDIGPETIKKFKEIIAFAKTIVWNGPLGKFEEKPYDTGTNEVLKAVMESGAFVLMGGGESVEILEEQDAMEKISFVSTGGGAMLEYMSGKELPGIKALEA
ncbi:MAG: phosphoglycerate kinase [Parcubacteria group bacterium]|jgi:phosphoglycerate kinase